MIWQSLYASSSNSHSPSPPSSSNAFSLGSSEQDHPSTSGCRLATSPYFTSLVVKLSVCSLLLSIRLLDDGGAPHCDGTGETLSVFCDACVSCSCPPCSSEQSAKAKTQKELFKTLKELKMHLPSEKRSKGKSSTINTLKYALRCIKQVKGKSSYDCSHSKGWINPDLDI